MIWDILQTKLTAGGPALVAGQSLFLDQMPADCRRGVLLRSPLSGVQIDQYIPGYYKPLLQVIVRHTDPVDGDAFASQVNAALTIQTIEHYPAVSGLRGKVELKMFCPRELPIRFPRLDGSAIEWSTNFLTAFSLAPT